MRRSLILAAGLAAIVSTSPAAGATSTQSSITKQVQKALHVTADGVVGPKTKSAIRAFQRAHGLQPDGIAGPLTLAALGVTAGAAKASPPITDPQQAAAYLTQLAECESNSDPTRVDGTGKFRGKYQFARSTWKHLGFDGDPAAAPEDVQDEAATKLLATQGPDAWPACSREIRRANAEG